MAQPSRLRRQLGLPGAVGMGLGSILGTGVFVSIGLGAEVAGAAVLLALALAALLALCNGLSSAQLAASHPVSGGTYEYGYRYLMPTAGFTAGWMFLCAKSASAATAALGLAGYLTTALGLPPQPWQGVIALGAVAGLTAIVLTGVRLSAWANAAIVSVTLTALGAFILAGLPTARAGGHHFTGMFEGLQSEPAGWSKSLLHATALMFVAYTGYGRIATLGEEVRRPRRTIPRAILLTLAVSLLLYVGVAAVAVGTVGAEAYGEATQTAKAPLEVIARHFRWPWVSYLLAAGAVVAMAGVLLNLLLGLSRVLLAMGRRGDMPRATARINRAGTTPYVAVLAVAGAIALLTLLRDVKLTWSLSASSVLIYYAVTNAAALRLPAERRRYPRWIAALGLAGCLLLAFQVEARIWGVVLALIAAGLLWQALMQRMRDNAAP